MTEEVPLQSYAVELYFDAAGEAAILELRAALHAGGIAASPRLLDTRPHVSLAVLEAREVGRLLGAVEDFVTAAAPFALTLGAVGSFAGDGHVLFLVPTPTKDLLDGQRELHRRVRAAGIEGRIWEHYLPDRWTPHCTLEMEIGAERLPSAFAMVRASLRPISVFVEEVGVVGFPPVASLGSFSLRR